MKARPTFTIVHNNDEPDDPLAPVRGIVNGLLITLGAVLLVVLWLAGPVWMFSAGVVGLVLLAPWGRRTR